MTSCSTRALAPIGLPAPVITPDPRVRLARVDAALLDRLTRVAVSDASADEVTPPLTPGNAWTPERVAWFATYHRECATGLSGPRREVTWAVLLDDAPVGAVRLAATDEPGILDCGLWLARSARGRGLAPDVMARAVAQARRTGATIVRADTAETNLPALATLRQLGFAVDPPSGGRVRAHLRLASP